MTFRRLCCCWKRTRWATLSSTATRNITQQPSHGLGFPESFPVERLSFPKLGAWEQCGGGLLNSTIRGTPRVSDSAGFGSDPNICLSNKLPRAAAGPGPHT